jgi:CP family cyanate transporter-like MFS transporter
LPDSEVPTKAAAVALVVVALNLRLTIAAVSPVLAEIQGGTGLSSTGAGLLTAVPIVCFGAVALAAPRLIRRVGMGRLLGLTMVVVAAGAALRLVPSLAALFAGTAVIGAGIAVANVVMPGIIKRDFGRQSPAVLGLYSMCLFVGAAVTVGLTVPLQHATGLGWRPAIAVWGIAAVVAALAWAPFARREPTVRSAAPAARATSIPRRLWSDPLAWQVTLFMGLQSFSYYAPLAWIPTILEAHGMSAGSAGWQLSFSSFPGMAAALAAPAIERRLRHPRVLVVAAVGLCAAAYAGLLASPVSGTYAWMTLLGLGQGLSISLALGYIVARSPDAHHTAYLSTMAQGVGYLIACTGPFLLGALHAATGGWSVPLLVLVVVLVPLLLAGLGAARDRHVLAGTALG